MRSTRMSTIVGDGASTVVLPGPSMKFGTVLCVSCKEWLNVSRVGYDAHIFAYITQPPHRLQQAGLDQDDRSVACIV